MFTKAFEKTSAARSEIIGTLLTPAALPVALIGFLSGHYSAKDQKKANERGISNLIPGLGAYRLARRIAGSGMTEKERG